MCGRYTLFSDKEALAERFRFPSTELAELTPRYNIAPTSQILTVRAQDGERQPTLMRWGLIPHWAKPGQKLPLMINARVESVADKPAYRTALRTHRCLIVANGFYEWQPAIGPARRKLPHWIGLANREAFSMAGLYCSRRVEEELLNERELSCAIVTCPANEAVAPIHERMPVILHPEAEASWLDPELDGKAEELLRLLRPVPAESLLTQAVGFGVNSVKNDDPSLLEPGDDPQLGFD